jgi:hypothetical protein
MQPQPDVRWTNFIGGVDGNGRITPMSYEILAGLARGWARLLPESILIDGPADLLRQARSLFVQAWFDYEFMVNACLTGFQAMEAAFRVLYPDAPERVPLRTLIRRARNEGILPQAITDLADSGAELRNALSHPMGTAALTLGMAAPMLENTHRLVASVMGAAAQRDAAWRAAHQPT